MERNYPYITNLVNSIIGVSVLAMPFCLKQCGIILGLGLLLAAAWLTYLSCSMLASSAYQKRRRSYEYLALYTLGPTGKFAVELSMIGLMLGTCIAFYVVIGDLSYGTVAKFVPGADKSTLRMYTIIFTALCIALPLGNMKNLSVLSFFGFVSLLFYSAFLVVVVLNAVSNGLLDWEWLQKVNYWRPAGIFQSLPIFSLAYACQCQLFIVYSSLEEPTVHRVEDIVFGAIRFVTVAYMSIGFFGYTTYQEAIAGNLLLNFPSNNLLDFIKMGFAMSVVLGFPLMISPCRQSIHTLIFAQPAGEGMQAVTYIPPFLFKSITLGIVTLTMFIAIVIPNVETILGLTGASMGSMICFIFPALIYEKAHSSKTSSNTPKFVFVLGCILLVVCTYSNLSKISSTTPVEAPVQGPELPEINLDPVKVESNDVVIKEEHKDLDKDLVPNDKEELAKPKVVAEVEEGQDHRHEPPNPIEPDNTADDIAIIAKALEEKKTDTNDDGVKQDSPKEEIHVDVDAAPKENVESPVKQEELQKQEPAVVEKSKSPAQENVPPVKLAEKPNNENVNQNKDVVQEPKKPALSESDNNPPVNKENPNNPVIKTDDNVPVVDSQAKSNVEAQPGIQQGNPMKEQHVDKVENPPKVVPVADAAQKDGSKTGDDVADEKELLEKIKAQHDMQQQLWKEQEQLIKKLEEQHDKKDQAGEEDGQVGRIEQDPDQGAPRENNQEIREPVNPPQIQEQQNDIPLEQKPDLVNNDGIKSDVVLPVPQGGALQDDALIEEKAEDIVAKQDENGEDVPRPPENKVIAGRELLSNESEQGEDEMRESNDDGGFDNARSRGDELQNPANPFPAPNQDSNDQQNSILHPKVQPTVHVRVENIFQRDNAQGGKIPVIQNNGRRVMQVNPRWLQMQQQMERAHVQEPDEEAVRKPRDVRYDIEDGNGNVEAVHVSENDDNTKKEESVLNGVGGKKVTRIDTAFRIKLTEIANDSQQAFMEDNTEKLIEDELLDAKRPVSHNVDTEIEQSIDNAQELIRDIAKTSDQFDQNQKPLSDLENSNQVERHVDIQNQIEDSRDENGPVTDCLEKDLECWQSKSKLRELKSLDLN